MDVDFETWKQLVTGAKVTKVIQEYPNQLFLEFDTGMVCRISADQDKPLKFDYNWLQGFEFLMSRAGAIHVKNAMENLTRERHHD